jgi:ferric-dicitrate binding protein FerR (iron transport regulator)
MENKMKIENLIKKFHLGTLPEEDLVYLLNYLRNEEPEEELMAFYQNTWDKTCVESDEINSQILYNQLTKKLGIPNDASLPAAGSPEKLQHRGYFRLIMRYAAIFLVAFGLSWLAHHFLFNETATPVIASEEQFQIIEVPYGSKTRVVLPDNSVVMLNSGSSLKYSNSNFNSSRRSVSLTGEGFFSVTKNSSSPFYVITPGIKVKVLGTTFNVKAYPDDDVEETTLVSGKVEIYARSDKSEMKKPIVLKPNQSALFLKSENNFQTVNSDSPSTIPIKLEKISPQSSSKTEKIISWKENTLVFDNECFSSLIVKIERWYDVKIEVNYPELNSARFSGKFDKETLEQVLNAIRTITPFEYNIKQNKVSISKK